MIIAHDVYIFADLGAVSNHMGLTRGTVSDPQDLTQPLTPRSLTASRIAQLEALHLQVSQ